MLNKILLCLILLLVPTLAKADTLSVSDLIKGLKFDEGIGYDTKNDQITYTSTVVLLEYQPTIAPKNKLLYALYKGDPAFNVGYSTSDKAIVGVSISLGGLSDLGVQAPILKAIQLQPMASYSFYHIGSNVTNIKNSWIFGAKILNVTF